MLHLKSMTRVVIYFIIGQNKGRHDGMNNPTVPASK